jgi:hypothetical protein
VSGDEPASKPPRVLISYSHESEEHVARVLALAQQLRADWVDAWIDRFVAPPPEGWSQWMQGQLKLADRIIVVCTPTYSGRASRDAPAGVGLGVSWEWHLIRKEVYETRGEGSRIVPVFCDADGAASIPPEVWDRPRHDVSKLDGPGYLALLDDLFGRPEIAARPVGAPRTRAAPLPVAPVSPTAAATGSARTPAPRPPAAGGATARVALERLLLDMFGDSELRRFVAYLPGGDELKAQLPSGGAPVDFAHALVARLVRRGEVDGALFDALAVERPRRAAEIASVHALFRDQVDATDRAEEHLAERMRERCTESFIPRDIQLQVMQSGPSPAWAGLSMAEILAQEPFGRFTVQGPPGSGKTTLLRSLAIDLLSRRAARADGRQWVPVLLHINDVVETTDINTAVDRAWPGAGRVAAAALKEGRLALLIDGLDETATPDVAARRLEQWLPRSAIVVTTRERGFRGLRGYIRLQMRPEPVDTHSHAAGDAHPPPTSPVARPDSAAETDLPSPQDIDAVIVVQDVLLARFRCGPILDAIKQLVGKEVSEQLHILAVEDGSTRVWLDGPSWALGKFVRAVSTNSPEARAFVQAALVKAVEWVAHDRGYRLVPEHIHACQAGSRSAGQPLAQKPKAPDRGETASASLFISYSHLDDKYRSELDAHLSIMRRQGTIRVWYDLMLGAGDEVHEEILRYLNKADVVVCLLSASFLASDYCFERELPAALARRDAGKAVVVGVRVRPAMLSGSVFENLRYLPTDGRAVTEWENRDSAWVDVVKMLSNLVNRLQLRPKDTTVPPADGGQGPADDDRP